MTDKKPQFKVGDIVVGLSSANKDTVWIITQVYPKGNIELNRGGAKHITFTSLYPEHFELAPIQRGEHRSVYDPKSKAHVPCVVLGPGPLAQNNDKSYLLILKTGLVCSWSIQQGIIRTFNEEQSQELKHIYDYLFAGQDLDYPDDDRELL